MSNPNNPAGRLHAVIQKAKAAEKKVSDSDLFIGWRLTLELTEMNRAEVLYRIGLIGDLPHFVALAIKELELPSNTYLTWVKSVRSTLSTANLNEKFGSTVAKITPDQIGLIAICDDQLSRNAPEATADQERLKELQTQLQTLIKELQSDSSMSPSLRDHLLKHLVIIEHALADYQLIGAQSIQDAFVQTVGMAATAPSATTEDRQSSTYQAIIKRLSEFVVIYETLHIASKALPWLKDGLATLGAIALPPGP